MQTQQAQPLTQNAYMTLVVTRSVDETGTQVTTQTLSNECVTDTLGEIYNTRHSELMLGEWTQPLCDTNAGGMHGPNGSYVKAFSLLGTIAQALDVLERAADQDIKGAENMVSKLTLLCMALEVN